MGLLSRISSVATPARLRASASTPSPLNDFWYSPEGWLLALGEAGIKVSPELALTLSYVHCAVSTISDDFGTMTCQMFRDLGDSGRDRVRYSDPGIGALAFLLRWQPNAWQTAKGFWSTLCWQYLLRPAAYAEIVYQPGSASFVSQIVPRHPDRVTEERLASGRVRFRLTESDGKPRWVTQDEMLVVRNTSSDGLAGMSRVQYGAKGIATGLALQDYTRNYFKQGTAAALLASYKGEKDEDTEVDLHGSLTRFANGTQNAGGILVVPEDIDVKNLGVDPKQAELLGLKELSGRDVARLFKMPPHKLFISGTATYASQVQSAQEYVSGCQMPITVEFEQCIQRDLIIQRDKFFAKFNMDYLLRADLKTRMESYEIGIRSRVIRPSEARVREDLPPDPALDKLSESDFRPGAAAVPKNGSTTGGDPGQASLRAELRQVLFVHAEAERCLRRERAAVAKIAQRHANDVTAWHGGLREFYGDHATFLTETLRVPMEVARAFCAQHGSEFETKGAVDLLDDDKYTAWERFEADELTLLALSDGGLGVDDWFDRRLTKTPPAPSTVIVNTPVTLGDGAVQVDARTTVERTTVEVQPATVTIQKGAVQNTVHMPKRGRVTTDILRDEKRDIVKTITDEE